MNKLILSVNISFMGKVKKLSLFMTPYTREVVSSTSPFSTLHPNIKFILQLYLGRRMEYCSLVSSEGEFEVKFESTDELFLVTLKEAGGDLENFVDRNCTEPRLHSTGTNCTYEIMPYVNTGAELPITPVMDLIEDVLEGADELTDGILGRSMVITEYTVVDETTVHLHYSSSPYMSSVQMGPLMLVVKYEEGHLPNLFKADLIVIKRKALIESIRDIDGVAAVTDLGLGIAVEVPNGISFIVRYKGTYSTRSNTIINCHYTNMIIASVLQVMDHTDYRVINDGILNIVIS